MTSKQESGRRDNADLRCCARALAAASCAPLRSHFRSSTSGATIPLVVQAVRSCSRRLTSAEFSGLLCCPGTGSAPDTISSLQAGGNQ
eukprot:scaffold655148_cov42-Prasinocladus_malaysianus.AAC.1